MMLVMVRSTVVNIGVGISVSRVVNIVSSVSHRMVVMFPSILVNCIVIGESPALFTQNGRTRCNYLLAHLPHTWLRLVSCTDADR